MGIRWKFLLLLMAIGLMPMVAMTVISQHETRELGHSLSRDAIKALDDIISNELAETARNYAAVLNREKDLLELTIYLLAQRVKDLYTLPVPMMHGKLYLSEDFNDPDKAPPSTVSSSRHPKLVGNATMPMEVSYDHQDFLLAPGVEPKNVAEDMHRLAGLLPFYKAGRPELEDLIYWMYVSLKKGVHASYPGHGDYPKGYDPRKRDWFEKGLKATGINWTKPYVDAASGQVIMTATVPVQAPTGEILGLAGLDVLLSRALQVGVLSNQWDARMRSLIVIPETDPETGQPGLAVVAKADYAGEGRSWKEVIRLDWFRIKNQDNLKHLVREIEQGKTGYQDVNIGGNEHICAYAHVADDLSVLILIPKTVIYEQTRNVEKTVLGATYERLFNTGITALVVIGLVLILALYGARAVTEPLKHLAWAVGRLANGDFSVRVDTSKYFRAKDERLEVAQAFNDMVPQLEDRMRMSRDLRLAKEVQQNLLPRLDPDLPGFDISGRSVYCDETGGDYVDFIQVDYEPDTMCVVVGDVTGHGVPAALLMATVRAQLMSLAVMKSTLSKALEVVNRLLGRDVADSGRFMTLFAMLLDAKTRRAIWASAGHDPALLLDPDTDSFTELPGDGLPLGVVADATFATDNRILSPGQIVFLGTDGIWEARNPQKAMYGKDRLKKVIRANASASARNMIKAVLADLERFRDGMHQEDDVTMVVVKVLGDNKEEA